MAKDTFNVNSIDKMKKEEQFRSRIKKIRYGILALILFSVVVFVAIAVLAVANEGLDNFVGSLLRINIYYLIAALLAVFVSYAMRFPKWQIYMRQLKVRISLKKSFLIYMSMFSMDITPGRWGRAVVSFTMNRATGARFSRTFPAVVADIFTDFVGFAIVAVLAVLFVNQYVYISIILIALTFIPFIFLYRERPFRYLRNRLGNMKILEGFFNAGNMYFRNKKMLNRRAYVYSIIFTVPSVILIGIALYLVILGFGASLGLEWLPAVIFIYCSSTLIGMASGSPGTLGVTDAALLGELSLLLPIDFGIVAATTIIFRIATVWFVELFGFGSLIYTFRYWD